MLTLVFGTPVSKGKVNRSLDFSLIAKEITGDCEQGFIFKHLQVKYVTSCGTIAMILNKLHLQVMVL